jgi:phenylalanyl-tRNA synthetase alpha chain
MDIKVIDQELGPEAEGINSLECLESFRLKYLGRKGIIIGLTSSIAGLPKEERAAFGQQVNELKRRVSSIIAEKEAALGKLRDTDISGSVDLGLPGIANELGRLHPLTQVMDEICAVFRRLGFSVVEGPEIETEYNNFTALNIPLEHPSRDAFDTFYIGARMTGQNRRPQTADRLLLRSHTSPVQIRVMKSRRPPLAVVVPGAVFRPDAVDAAHMFMFHQIEGFMVDTNIRFSDLKGVLRVFAEEVFGREIQMRFRPHFFPFTEPSAEVDISCIICRREQKTENRKQKKRCSVCGGKGWLEILGAGMIHRNVLRNVGYNPDKYSGFAFGLGIERIAMLKYGIDDIRLFFQNDLRFLRQF